MQRQKDKACKWGQEERGGKERGVLALIMKLLSLSLSRKKQVFFCGRYVDVDTISPMGSVCYRVQDVAVAGCQDQ